MINTNFQKLWLGRFISNFGDSIYTITVTWVLAMYTDDPFWLGLLNTFAFLPTIFSFAFGHIIDRYSLRKLLYTLELGQGLAAIFITTLFVLKVESPLLICISVLFASMFGMNTYIVQDTFVPNLVKKHELEKAQVYMSLGYKTADMVFNAISGILMAVFSPVILLASSVLSFFTSAALFKSISSEGERKVEEKSEKTSLFSGFAIIFSSKFLTVLTICGMIVNFFFAGLNIYIVLIAKNLGSPIALGLLNAAFSVGTIMGATYYGQRILKGKSLSQKLVIGTIGFGVSVLFVSLFVNDYLVILVFIISGISLGLTHIVLNPIIQTVSSGDSLGRVFSAKYTIEVGIMPIASLFFGKVAGFLSTELFFLIFGLVYVAVGIAYYFTFRNYSNEKTVS